MYDICSSTAIISLLSGIFCHSTSVLLICVHLKCISTTVEVIIYEVVIYFDWTAIATTFVWTWFCYHLIVTLSFEFFRFDIKIFDTDLAFFLIHSIVEVLLVYWWFNHFCFNIFFYLTFVLFIECCECLWISAKTFEQLVVYLRVICQNTFQTLSVLFWYCFKVFFIKLLDCNFVSFTTTTFGNLSNSEYCYTSLFFLVFDIKLMNKHFIAFNSYVIIIRFDLLFTDF